MAETREELIKKAQEDHDRITHMYYVLKAISKKNFESEHYKIQMLLETKLKELGLEASNPVLALELFQEE